MILLDAYALIALLLDEPPADDVERLLDAGEVAMVSVNLAEVLDHLMRRRSVTHEVLAGSVGPMLDEVITVLPVEDADAWRAASIRATHHRRRVAELSLADCFLLAAATAEDRIATADPVIAAVARAEGIELLALADSAGRLP